ncbi:MAG: hypothetical protein ABSC87_03845 [Halobacteriota archaeon]
MAQIHRKRHVKLAKFGCVRCGRFLFAPRSYELDHDVVVCACDASRYKTISVRAPRHVQAYWDAQCRAAYSSYRRRLKRYALPSVHAERLASDVLGWSVISVDDESVNEAILDYAALSVSNPDSTATPTSFQQQTFSILHACRSALVSGLSRVADVEREHKGKAS